MRTRNGWTCLAAVAGFAALALAGAAGSPARAAGEGMREADHPGGRVAFRGLDRNNDGRISRAEWRGGEQGFAAHDTNRDGFLSGNELDPALRASSYDDFSELDRNRDRFISRDEWLWERSEFDQRDDDRSGSLTRAEYLNAFPGKIAPDFRDYDRNNDGKIGRGEWRGDFATFVRLDDNRDDVLTRAEFLNRPGPGAFPPPAPAPAPLQDRFARFARLDRNGNGRISREEWPDDRKSFDALDDDRDGVLNRDEFLEITQEERLALFKQSDLNRNGSISRKEWNGGKQSFDKLDANGDGLLAKDEFLKTFKGVDDHFRQLDRDNDGRLSRGEWRGDSKEFTRMDHDRNGQLTFDEFLPVV